MAENLLSKKVIYTDAAGDEFPGKIVGPLTNINKISKTAEVHERISEIRGRLAKDTREVRTVDVEYTDPATGRSGVVSGVRRQDATNTRKCWRSAEK